MLRSGVAVSTMKNCTTKQAVRAKPTISRKIDCQPKRPSAMPPRVGETAGPSASIMPIMFMIRAAVVPVN